MVILALVTLRYDTEGLNQPSLFSDWCCLQQTGKPSSQQLLRAIVSEPGWHADPPSTLNHWGPAQRPGSNLIHLGFLFLFYLVFLFVVIIPLQQPWKKQIYINWQLLLQLHHFCFSSTVSKHRQLSLSLECVSCTLIPIMWQSLWFILILCKDFSLSKLIFLIYLFIYYYPPSPHIYM